MKNLFKFVTLLAIIFGVFTFGQNFMNQDAQELINATHSSTDKKVKFCTTTSCCAIGSFGVDVWSETTCSYILTYKNGNSKVTVIDLKTIKGEKYSKNEITIANDIIVPAQYENQGGEADVDVLKAGRYLIIDGQLAFTPVTQRVRLYCLVTEHNGTIFGNPYSYTTAFCTVSFGLKTGINNNGVLIIDISENKLLLDLARKNKNTLRFDEDLVINNSIKDKSQAKEELKIVIKAGTYIVNDDNKIYIQNYEIR